MGKSHDLQDSCSKKRAIIEAAQLDRLNQGMYIWYQWAWPRHAPVFIHLAHNMRQSIAFVSQTYLKYKLMHLLTVLDNSHKKGHEKVMYAPAISWSITFHYIIGPNKDEGFM